MNRKQDLLGREMEDKPGKGKRWSDRRESGNRDGSQAGGEKGIR